MIAENLQVGIHLSTTEKLFVDSTVIPDLRQKGYVGQVLVVGSREQGHRISTKAFLGQCFDLPKSRRDYWQKKLDEIAQVNDIPAGNIRSIKNFLPPETPPEVRKIFTKLSPPDSDLDLAIDADMGIYPSEYRDQPFPDGSGIVVEIYARGDDSYALQSHYDF